MRGGVGSPFRTASSIWRMHSPTWTEETYPFCTALFPSAWSSSSLDPSFVAAVTAPTCIAVMSPLSSIRSTSVVGRCFSLISFMHRATSSWEEKPFSTMIWACLRSDAVSMGITLQRRPPE